MRKTREILPNLDVDLGQLGKFNLKFDEVNIEDADLTQAISQQPSIYAWYSAVEEELTRIVKVKKLEYDKWYGEKRMELTNTATSKLTVKDLDSMMDSDDDGFNLRKEIIDLDSKVDRVKGYLVSLGMRHSVLLELSERERWGWSQTRVEKHTEVSPEVVGQKYRRSRTDED